jgi:hypothetical protein
MAPLFGCIAAEKDRSWRDGGSGNDPGSRLRQDHMAVKCGSRNHLD